MTIAELIAAITQGQSDTDDVISAFTAKAEQQTAALQALADQYDVPSTPAARARR